MKTDNEVLAIQRQRDLLLLAVQRIATINVTDPRALQDCIAAAAMALAVTGAR